MNQAHIAILHYTALPVIGGVENVIAEHTRLFLDAGYPVTILTGRGGSDNAFARANVVTIPQLDSQHPENLRIMRAFERGIEPAEFATLESQIVDLLSPICSEADFLIAHNVFNLHLNLPLTSALHRLLNRGIVRRFIAWCHDVSHYVNPTSGDALRFGFPWDLLRTHRADVDYVAVSQRRRRVLARMLGCPREEIRLIPNGVDPQALLGLSGIGRELANDLDWAHADLIILMPVRITRAKNIEFSMQVMAALKSSGWCVKLVVVGPPDPHSVEIKAYVDELLAMRRALQLEQEVVFLFQGTCSLPHPLTLDYAVVGDLYRMCDLVLMPSRREGFGLPILEAGLVGKPLFATTVPALEEVGLELAHHIQSGDSPDQVAVEIATFATEDKAMCLRRRVRQEFTWSRIFNREIAPLLIECLRVREGVV